MKWIMTRVERPSIRGVPPDTYVMTRLNISKTQPAVCAYFFPGAPGSVSPPRLEPTLRLRAAARSPSTRLAIAAAAQRWARLPAWGGRGGGREASVVPKGGGRLAADLAHGIVGLLETDTLEEE